MRFLILGAVVACGVGCGVTVVDESESSGGVFVEAPALSGELPDVEPEQPPECITDDDCGPCGECFYSATHAESLCVESRCRD